MIRWLKQNPVISYFIIAYAVTWSVEIPLALAYQGFITAQIPLWLHYTGSVGPLAAALILTALTEGRAGIRELLGRVARWRAPGRYYAYAVLLPLGLFAVAYLLNRVFTGSWSSLALLGQVDYLPYLTPFGTLGLWLLTFGLGEETGWRGFALPHLQKTRSAAASTLILGVLWACWHLPAFFYRDTYIQMGPLAFPMLAVSLIFAAMIFTWLYNSTGGSLLIVILFHALFDWLTTSDAGGPFAGALLSIAVILWALYIPRRYGLENVSPLVKQVA